MQGNYTRKPHLSQNIVPERSLNKHITTLKVNKPFERMEGTSSQCSPKYPVRTWTFLIISAMILIQLTFSSLRGAKSNIIFLLLLHLSTPAAQQMGGMMGNPMMSQPMGGMMGNPMMPQRWEVILLRCFPNQMQGQYGGHMSGHGMPGQNMHFGEGQFGMGMNAFGHPSGCCPCRHDAGSYSSYEEYEPEEEEEEEEPRRRSKKKWRKAKKKPKRTRKAKKTKRKSKYRKRKRRQL
ncbi:hypothetical protein RF11_06171 [Thelohanellus kitauei]|uniref:Uncharacterized protein n=1 Tax=Thelohanellus kitauei TaxID=669202 RepID=A0A0C2MPU3_THEKT|nr:hypothetical protein RF11_06171 [Thelohanellus kitauei]